MSFKPTIRYGAATLFAPILLISCMNACNTGIPIEISTVNPSSSFTGSIFIEGAVNNPGLYRFGQKDTLGDLLQAAGGLKDGATISQVTLTIPEPDSDASPQLININTADVWLLTALPGIGNTYAQAIVAYRNQNGPFRLISDLLKIKGIGQTTFDKIKGLVTIS